MTPVAVRATPDAAGVNEREIARLAQADRTSWWIRGRRALVSAVLRSTRPGPGGLVGDLGCGAGGMREAFRGVGPVVGIDLSPLAIDVCRAKDYRWLALGALERLPLRGETLDLAGVTDVLEHVEDDERVVRECLRVLKPGGILLVTVPALRWLYSDHDRALGHIRRYSRADVRRLFSRSGFQIERITYFNTLLLPLAIVFRIAGMLRRGPRSRADPLDLGGPWNWIAYHVFAVEQALIRFIDLPVGLSLLCVVRKPAPEVAGRP